MKKGILLLVMASSLGLCASQQAYAENRAGAFTVTPGAAYDFFANRRNLNNTWLLPTIALGYNFDERWGIEAAYGTFGTHQSSRIGGRSVKGNLYTVDGLFRFGHYTFFQKFDPYVSFGVGAYHINPNGTDATNQANINAGLGTQIFFGDSVALRGEVRDLYTMAGGKNDVTLGFGVSFLFGGNTPETTATTYKDVAVSKSYK